MAFPAGDQSNSGEADEHAAPAYGSQFLMQPESGSECGPDGHRRNQHAGGARRHASLSVVERQIIETDPNGARKCQAREIA